MIFRNSIKNLLRSRGKTALFFALILILTLLIGLAAYVRGSVGGYLASCEDSYTTIGVFEYMGADYPDESVYDAGAAQAREDLSVLGIADMDGVELWDDSGRALGCVDGYKRVDNRVYNKDLAVLIVRARKMQTNGTRAGTIVEALYSYGDCEGYMLNIDENGQTELESGHYYIVTGEYVTGHTSYLNLLLEPFGPTADTAYLDITDPGSPTGYTVPEDCAFLETAETINILNNSLEVFPTADIDTQLLFHQGTLSVDEGRAFTDEEYGSGAKVCIVSSAFCAELGLTVGDSFPLSLMAADGQTASGRILAGDGFDSTADYTIVGIMDTLPDMRHYVYVPAGADEVFQRSSVGYTLGAVLLDDPLADSFYNDISVKLGDRARLTIYDQGYAAAAGPFSGIMRVTNIVSAVCVLAGVCVIALFGYLFVYRQRGVSVTMMRLGTGKKRVCGYFIYGAGILALVSAALGAVLGYGLTGKTGDLIAKMAETAAGADLRYSDAALSAERISVFTPSASAAPFILAAAAIVLAAAASCLLFTLGTFAKKRVRARNDALPEKKKRAGGRNTGGYALLSIARGGARSATAPVTALLAAVFLCQTAASGAAYRAEYASLCENTVISGSVTDISGNTSGDLVVTGLTVNALLASGYIDELTVSTSYVYLYEGVTYSDGVTRVVPEPDYPTGGFAYETFLDKVFAGPSIICTNSLERSPEFYYSSHVETEFLDGYDPGLLASDWEYGEDIPCILPTSLMEEQGIELGDRIQVKIFYGNRTQRLELLAAGSYVKAGVKDNIYCPLAAYVSTDELTAGEDDPDWTGLRFYSFKNADFTLSDASELGDFKDYLAENGFSGVGDINSTRVFILLRDRSFNDTSENLTRQIQYTGVLYPALYALTFAAGLVAAYLLVLHRRREYAIMRALGTPKARSFMNFFTEQLLLCLAGTALGLAAAAVFGTISASGVRLAAGFAVCWLCGSAAALIRMNGSAVLDAMHKED